MALIGLGRTNTKPLFLLFQMTYAISLFFSLLGLFRVLFEIQNRQQNTTFYITVESLFKVTTVTTTTTTTTTASIPPEMAGNHTTSSTPTLTPQNGISTLSYGQFFGLHWFTSAALSYPLSQLIGRRKLVPDFIVTVYLFYFVVANVVLGRVYGGNLYWWATVLIAGVLNGGGLCWFWCKKLEMSIIPVAGGNDGGNPNSSHHNSSKESLPV